MHDFLLLALVHMENAQVPPVKTINGSTRAIFHDENRFSMTNMFWQLKIPVMEKCVSSWKMRECYQ